MILGSCCCSSRKGCVTKDGVQFNVTKWKLKAFKINKMNISNWIWEYSRYMPKYLHPICQISHEYAHYFIYSLTPMKKCLSVTCFVTLQVIHIPPPPPCYCIFFLEGWNTSYVDTTPPPPLPFIYIDTNMYINTFTLWIEQYGYHTI